MKCLLVTIVIGEKYLEEYYKLLKNIASTCGCGISFMPKNI